jgi:carbon monoxide dehydrogenase subunit G
MTGQQRIEAPRQVVWEALNDPDVLRRSIPGCQSLDRESDERLRASVEIKIGPIGARFAGAVILSDMDPPNGYTLRGEGQGGTVGSVKGGAKVRLANDNGGTLLSYEVDAQVGGRLAQLGGPVIDATAKQLAGKFFKQFGEIVGAPAAAVPSAAMPVGAAMEAASGRYAPVTQRGLPIAWILAVVVAFLVGFLVGRSQGVATGSDWAGISIGLLVVIVAAAGFEFGRRAAAPVLMLDPALLARLAKAANE